ncbi:MAG TPA: class I SAM-dependent methyltransferase [Desulfosporosinus sp.]
MTTSITLGVRLQTVASFVPEGAKLGDIGTDHAYLPIALYEADRILKAVAVDVHEGPYQSALAAVKGRHLDKVIEVRFGDGLMPLEPGEVNVITLAGMGGRTMLDILSARPDVLNYVSDLIVQPQGGAGTVRLELLEGGWLLKAEQLVEEDDLKYVVMAFSKVEGQGVADLLKIEHDWIERLQPLVERGSIEAMGFLGLVHRLVFHFGPLILAERTELLSGYLNEHSGMLLKRLAQMKKSQNLEIGAKIREVYEELVIVEGLRTWQ